MPTIQGFIPSSTACTYGLSRMFLSITTMSSIMTKAGRTTAAVAIAEPRIPPWELPM